MYVREIWDRTSNEVLANFDIQSLDHSMVLSNFVRRNSSCCNFQ